MSNKNQAKSSQWTPADEVADFIYRAGLVTSCLDHCLSFVHHGSHIRNALRRTQDDMPTVLGTSGPVASCMACNAAWALAAMTSRFVRHAC
jgi:hypothetical protein